MKKYVDKQGSDIKAFLKCFGDVAIGYSNNEHKLVIEDFDNAELFSFAEGFAVGSFEANQTIEECELYYNNPQKYYEVYEQCEPSDSMLEVYEILTEYEVDYYTMNELDEVDVLWVRKKGEKK